MTAPTQVATTNSTGNATTTASLSGCQAGDLIVIVANASVDSGITVQSFVDSVGGASLGTPVLDIKATNGTAAVYIWSVVLATTPGGTVSLTMTNWPTSGNRRILMAAYRPGAGEVVPGWGPNRVARLTDTTAGDTGADGFNNDGGSIGHTTLTAAGTRQRPGVAIMCTQGGTGALTGYDFNADGNADSSNLYGTSPATNNVQGGYQLLDEGHTKVTTGTKFQTVGAQSSNINAAAAVVYLVEPRAQGRAVGVAKSSGRGTIHKYAQGRAVAVAAAAARYVTSAGQTKLNPGRARAVAAASGLAHLFTPRANGRANVVGKAAARFFHRPVSHARGRAVSSASTAGFVRRLPAVVGAARSVSVASGAANLFVAKRDGRARAVARATGAGTIRKLSDGRARTISAASARFTTAKRVSGAGVAIGVASSRGYVRAAVANGRARSVLRAVGAAFHFVPTPGEQVTVTEATVPAATLREPTVAAATLIEEPTTL